MPGRSADGSGAGGGSANEAGPELVEGHVEVARSARYWMLGDPSAEPEEVWFVLHGYGQLARRFLRRFSGLAAPSRLVVAPEALSRFYLGSGVGRHARDALVGATWMTREDRESEIRDYADYLDRLASALPTRDARVTVLGFSQGVATAWRWVSYGSVPNLARFVAWAGELPPDLDLDRTKSALDGVDVVLVTGEKDDTVPPGVTEDTATRLDFAGVAYRALRHGRGHDIDEAALLEIAG